MLLRSSKVYNSIQINNIWKTCFSTATNEKWDLFTSVCVERKPIVSQLLNELEADFKKYLSKAELERSLLSDHEIKHINDKKQAELLKTIDREDVDLDAASLQTAEDYVDACNDELNKFKFATRKTEADKTNDLKSLKRKLDKYLVLFVEQKIGNKIYFLPPQTIINDGETLKQSAERTLKNICGNEMKTQIYGNAPVGFYKYKYPKQLQKDGIAGAKIFIYFARYLKGEMQSLNKCKWLDRMEMKKEIPEEYFNSLSKFLIDETETQIM